MNWIYKLHKYLAVAVGAFVLMWFVTGIVIILPQWSDPPGRQRALPVDFAAVLVSPGEAVAELAKVRGERPDVASVSLSRMAGVVVYKIDLTSGSSYLVDATSGKLLTVTPEWVERIARDRFSPQARIREIKLVTEHGFRYLGPLPAYRVVLDDERATVAYISVKDSMVMASDRWRRLKSVMLHLHTFHNLTMDRERIRRGLLLAVSVLGIGAVATGYYLAYPRRRKAN